LVLVLAALEDEVSALVRRAGLIRTPSPAMVRVYRDRWAGRRGGLPCDLVVALSGAGAARAEAAAEWAIAEFKPSACLATGFAGGCRGGLGPGVVVLASEVILVQRRGADGATGTDTAPLLPDAALFAAARRAGSSAGLRSVEGRLVTVHAIAATAGQKSRLADQFGVAAAEMETYHYGAVAARSSVPFVAAKAVVDTASTDLPEFVTRLGDGPAPALLVPALMYLSRRPAGLPSLLRLGRAAARARDSISRFVPAFAAEFTPAGASSGTGGPR
jgi:adenosylhomocysteine nucleosidase